MTEPKRDAAHRRAPRTAQRPALRIVDTPPNLPTSPSRAPVSIPVPEWVRHYRLRLEVSDTLIIVAAVLVAFLTRFWWGGSAASLTAIAANYWLITAAIVGTWIVTLSAYRTRDTRVVGIGAAEYRRVVSASILAFGLLAILFLILDAEVARGFFVLALPLGLVGLLLNRWMWRNWLIHKRQAGEYLSRTIVVGDREDVEYVISQIDKKAHSVYHVVGAATDWDNSEPLTVNSKDYPLVSGLDDVAQAAALLGVNAVIVAGQPSGDANYIRDLGWNLEGTAAELVVASGLTNIAGPRIHFRPVEGLPLMHVELPQFAGGKHVLKRAFDMSASACALLFFLPLMIVIAVLVRRDSPGPVLFRQERVGRNGELFQMIKFRSMVHSAEDDLAGLLDENQAAGVLFKIRNDPRITRVGRILRKYSLDELPQVWNIFVGDMSVVGPRPPLPHEVEGYESHVHRRLYIKPGLTGMWQVNGRSNLSWEDSVRLDLYYVENWSMTGDLMIIWRTFKAVLNPVGAY